jgi:protein-L-isoaspartate(D-aspartate) O-methyltransferase
MDTMSTDAGADYVAMRHAMVASQLRPNAVDDPRVIAAMASIPREHFLPADARLLAYRDGAIPLGNARWANLPMTTGRLLTEARLAASDRVLLIGAAGGYAAAVLAEIVAQVVAVEGDPALAALARDAFVGRPRVTLVEAPLGDGHADGAPYDVLIVDGAMEIVPEALIAQVRTGGRVVAGIVDRGVTRLATGLRTEGGFALVPFADLECVVLPGFAAPRPFAF